MTLGPGATPKRCLPERLADKFHVGMRVAMEKSADRSGIAELELCRLCRWEASKDTVRWWPESGMPSVSVEFLLTVRLTGLSALPEGCASSGGYE